MRQLRPGIRHRYQLSASVLVAALTSFTVLLPLTVGGADSAAAAPAAGYIGLLIPTGRTDSLAVDPKTDTVYFGSVSVDRLTVVDGSSNTVTGTIALPAGCDGIAADPATDTVYASVAATTSSPPVLDVIDGVTNKVQDTIPMPTGSKPTGVAVDSSTDTVYVAEEGAAAVAVIDGSTNLVTTTVGTLTEPFSLAVDEATDTVWAGEITGDVQAISTSSNLVTHTISPGGGAVHSVAVNPDTDTVYAATAAGGVAVIAGTTYTISTTINLTAPLQAVAVDPGSGTVFASTYETPGENTGTTWVINAATSAITDTIERGGIEAAFDTGNGSVYEAAFATLPDGGDSWVLTPSTADALSPVITSNLAATFYTGNFNSFQVTASAIPAATFTETGQLPAGVGLSPSGALFGTPAADSGGTYSFTITASNGIAPDDSEAFLLTVDELPVITIPSSATVRVGTPVNIPIQATSNPPPTAVGVYDLAPPGLSVTEPEPGSWALNGTPPPGSGGDYPTTIEATNSFGTTYANIDITIQEPPSITSAPTTTFQTDTDNSYAISIQGYPHSTVTTTGTLPAGVQVVFSGPSAGLIEGDPPATAAGTYHFTLTASNGVGTGTQAFTLIVEQPFAVGAQGGNGQLYVQAPQLASGWQSLGGQITGPPAVAAPPNPNGTTPASPVFFATGLNGELWMRSLTAPWQPVGPSGALCVGSPAAMVASDGTLTLACEGLNQALYYTTTTLPASGLPSFTNPWSSLGGILSAGPAVAPVGGTVTFFVRGTNGQIFTRTATAGYTATPWICNGAPAAAAQATTGTTTFACQGGDHSLWTATNSGTGWSAAVSVGGQLSGSPGIAAASQQVELFAEGTDGTVWQWTASNGWTSLGGIVTGGTGATALN